MAFRFPRRFATLVALPTAAATGVMLALPAKAAPEADYEGSAFALYLRLGVAGNEVIQTTLPDEVVYPDGGEDSLVDQDLQGLLSVQVLTASSQVDEGEQPQTLRSNAKVVGLDVLDTIGARVLEATCTARNLKTKGSSQIANLDIAGQRTAIELGSQEIEVPGLEDVARVRLVTDEHKDLDDGGILVNALHLEVKIDILNLSDLLGDNSIGDELRARLDKLRGNLEQGTGETLQQLVEQVRSARGLPAPESAAPESNPVESAAKAAVDEVAKAAQDTTGKAADTADDATTERSAPVAGSQGGVTVVENSTQTAPAGASTVTPSQTGAEQAGTEQGSTGQAAPANSSTLTPGQAGAEQAGTEQAGAEQGSTGQAAPANSSTLTPGQAGAEQAGTGQAAPANSSTLTPGQAGAEQAGTEQAGTGQAEPANSSTLTPGQAGAEQSGTEQAGTEQAGTEQAGTEQSGTEQSGTEQAAPANASTLAPASTDTDTAAVAESASKAKPAAPAQADEAKAATTGGAAAGKQAGKAQQQVTKNLRKALPAQQPEQAPAPHTDDTEKFAGDLDLELIVSQVRCTGTPAPEKPKPEEPKGPLPKTGGSGMDNMALAGATGLGLLAVGTGAMYATRRRGRHSRV